MITFGEYRDIHRGKATEDFFNEVVTEAEMFINARTLGKAERSSSLLPKVQKALTIYIDTLYTNYLEYKDRDRRGVKSETVLSHSVTYDSFDSSKVRGESKKEAEDKCLLALLPTGLLNTSVEYVQS